jgi:hypothetical protein
MTQYSLHTPFFCVWLVEHHVISVSALRLTLRPIHNDRLGRGSQLEQARVDSEATRNDSLAKTGVW